ncbi:MAG: hypothetical protein RLZZ524_3043, partial [Pseudomonadota bacterium]
EDEAAKECGLHVHQEPAHDAAVSALSASNKTQGVSA